MAKRETSAPVESDSSGLPAFLASYEGVPLSDIPDRDPLLAEGRWAFQNIGYTVKNLDSENGPFTMITVMLDPVEALEVEEPNEGFADLRQFHRIFVMRPGDLKNVKRFAAAFGVDDTLPAFRRTATGVEWPALEAAKGNVAEADAVSRKNKKSGEDEIVLKNFG